MLTYPQHIETSLEIDQIRQAIADECTTESSKSYLDKAKPLNNYEKLSVVLAQTREAIAISTNSALRLPGRLEDIQPLLKKLTAKGTFIQGDDFLMLKEALNDLHAWTQVLKKNKDEFPNLFQLTLGFITDIELAGAIDQTIDERGEIRTNASAELIHIRASLVKAEQKVRRAIRSILEQVKKDKFTDEDSEITVREGRLVIPVKAEHKRSISGFVHDESSTGQTVYMEPSQVLALNNEVREWQYEERREIQRILIQLSDRIRDSLDDLSKGARFLVLMDFILAKARFAAKYNTSIPTLHKHPIAKLVNAYHPLLKHLNDQVGKKTVPLNFTLSSELARMVIISGPNAGGKSVAMKTVGILQYMLQCGFPISADESSEMGIFNHIFVDIGDSQSLENDLSTYSSRLGAMKYMTEMADKRSLVLIDEFGSGTEPQFGGAIAEAILHRLGKIKCFGVITTHYSNIKKYAENKPEMMNAAMRYDTNRLEPLFELEVGRPGSSFAFEIARKIGLNDSLLNYAKGLIGQTHVDFDRLLTEVESDKATYRRKLKEVEKKESELKSLREDYESMRKMVDTDRKDIIRKAKEEAKALLDKANRDIERTIREIKESKADKERTKSARESLEKSKLKLKEIKENELAKPIKRSVVLEVGDAVQLIGQETIGEVVAISGKQAQVNFGSLKSFVEIKRLERISKAQARKIERRRIGGVDMNTKMMEFSHDLDIRGRRAEETFGLIEEFVDHAIMLGIDQVRVIHGKGHGVLRELVRNHLKGNPHIGTLSDEHEDRGGSGITIVSLK